MSQQEEDDRDLELRREIESAFQALVSANEADRLNARLHHRALLKAFMARIMNEPQPEGT